MILDTLACIFSRDNRFKSLSSLLFFFLLLSAVTTASASDQSNLRFEKNEPSEYELNDSVIRSIGAFQFEGDKQAHIDLVHTESLLLGNSLALDFGGGYIIRGSVSFFLGVGVALEYNFDIGELTDKYYAEAGATFDLSREISITARQVHFFNQPLEYEEVIMMGILFRH